MELLSAKVKTEKYSLFWLGDNHEGNANHCRGVFKEAVEYIEKTGKDHKSHVILGGDMADCINHRDKRFNPSEIHDKYKIRDLKDLPRKQCEVIFEDLNPIKNMVRGYIIGNHEEKYISTAGFDVYDYLAKKFPKCNKLGFSTIINLVLDYKNNKRRIIIPATHGTTGGGRTRTGKLKYCRDVFQKYRNADICIMGHTHVLGSDSVESIELNKNNKMVATETHYCVGGCFLKTYKIGSRNYFEGKPGDLSDIGFLEIVFTKRGGFKDGEKKKRR